MIIRNQWIQSDHSKLAACRKRKLLCATAFQEFEWHATEAVDYEDVQDEIPEISFESETSLRDVVDAV